MNKNELIQYAKEKHIKLIAVSKTQSISKIQELYNEGLRIFGENKVQELCEKYDQLPKDIEWHMIGHLQSNKVKYMAHFVSMIHSVDSLKLLEEINKQAMKNNRVQNFLLQVYVAQEETKFGLDKNELISLTNNPKFKKLENVRLRGLMAMASNTSDENQIRREFMQVNEIFNSIKNEILEADKKIYFTEKSMGMSNDFLIAVECGATKIRIGSLMFGPR
jgi:pyridoxal phosphate enzyme (YggS family)